MRCACDRLTAGLPDKALRLTLKRKRSGMVAQVGTLECFIFVHLYLDDYIPKASGDRSNDFALFAPLRTHCPSACQLSSAFRIPQNSTANPVSPLLNSRMNSPRRLLLLKVGASQSAHHQRCSPPTFPGILLHKLIAGPEIEYPRQRAAATWHASPPMRSWSKADVDDPAVKILVVTLSQ